VTRQRVSALPRVSRAYVTSAIFATMLGRCNCIKRQPWTTFCATKNISFDEDKNARGKLSSVFYISRWIAQVLKRISFPAIFNTFLRSFFKSHSCPNWTEQVRIHIHVAFDLAPTGALVFLSLFICRESHYVARIVSLGYNSITMLRQLHGEILRFLVSIRFSDSNKLVIVSSLLIPAN